MRAAVMEILGQDSVLNAIGIDEDRIWSNFALDGTAPRGDVPWIVLRWGATDVRFGGPGNRLLNIWAYKSRQSSADHSDLDKVLTRVFEIMMNTTHYTAADGGRISQVSFRGFSDDLIDEGYDAIARSIQLQVNGSD